MAPLRGKSLVPPLAFSLVRAEVGRQLASIWPINTRSPSPSYGGSKYASTLRKAFLTFLVPRTATNSLFHSTRSHETLERQLKLQRQRWICPCFRPITIHLSWERSY